MTCPKCRKQRVHRDERSGFIDQLFNWFVLKPYICHDCKYRFHRFPTGHRGPSARMEMENRIQQFKRRKGWKRTSRELVFYGLALILLGTVLYFVFRQSSAA